MRKDLKENTKQNKSDQQFVQPVRHLLKDWDVKVMSYVMVVVVMIATIAATVAWFLYFKVVAVSNMGMTTADCEVLKVEVKQGTTQVNNKTEPNFVEVKEGDESTVLVDLDMPVFDNVETYEITLGDTSAGGSQSGTSGTGGVSESDTQKKTVSKMAPGVYGSLTIRITPLSSEINSYKIKPAALFTYISGESDTVREGGVMEVLPGKEDLQNLAKGHILFFENRWEILDEKTGTISKYNEGTKQYAEEVIDIEAYTHNKKYVFDNQIESGSFVEGELKWNPDENKGEPKKVILYWYWPYEYDNLSSNIRTSVAIPDTTELQDILDAANSPENERYDKYNNFVKYFEKDKMQEIAYNSGSWNETQLYDYADTGIGTYVKSIKLHLEVKGYHATE